MLTVLVSTITNSEVFLLKKCAWLWKRYILSKILAYMPYLMIKFNDTLTNYIVSFEQQGPKLNRLLALL